MQVLEGNRLNQADVLVRATDGSEWRLRLGAGAMRAIATIPANRQDAVLISAADYAREHPLASDGAIYDNHIAAVTGGADDVPRWRRGRGLRKPAVPGPSRMPGGIDVLGTEETVSRGQASSVREVLQSLVGRTIQTATGAPNTVLGLTNGGVLVGTTRTPSGARVPIEWVQHGLDLLRRDGDVAIDTETLEHRSAFVAAVLLTLPGTRIEGSAAPPHVVLDGPPRRPDDAVGHVLRRRRRRGPLAPLDGNPRLARRLRRPAARRTMRPGRLGARPTLLRGGGMTFERRGRDG